MRFRPYIEVILGAKRQILSLLRGWKTRKIIKHRTLLDIQKQINDMKNLMAELKSSKSQIDLLQSMQQQLPKTVKQYRLTFAEFYKTGAWTIPDKYVKLRV